MNWFHRIAVRSHQPTFLWRVALAVLAAGVLVSIPLRLAQRDQGDPVLRSVLRTLTTPGHRWQVIQDLLDSEEVTLYQTLDAISQTTGPVDQSPPAEFLRAAEQRYPGGETSVIIQELADSLGNDQPTAALRELAARRPAVQHANFALAVVARCAERDSEAEAALRVEGRFPDALPARELLVQVLASQEDWQSLAELGEQEDYRSLVPRFVGAQLAAERGDWLGVLRRTPMLLFDSTDTAAVVLSLLAGASWLAFVLHAGRATQRGIRWTYCLAAVALGVLSIALTLFFLLWQEEAWGLVKSDDLAGSVRYYVLGVGLREELAKLVLLLPLVPFLVRDRSEVQALLVSACVGLGFALEENVAYFVGSTTSTIGRLTTANFLHMSLTGLVGLAVCRACWRPASLAPEAFGVFCLAVLIHGFYDALLVTPALADYSMVSWILYVLVVYRFFYEFNDTRPPGVYRLNLSFTLTLGVAVVASATFVVLSMQVGQWLALQRMGASLACSGVTIYLFLREAPDSLVDR